MTESVIQPFTNGSSPAPTPNFMLAEMREASRDPKLVACFSNSSDRLLAFARESHSVSARAAAPTEGRDLSLSASQPLNFSGTMNTSLPRLHFDWRTCVAF